MLKCMEAIGCLGGRERGEDCGFSWSVLRFPFFFLVSHVLYPVLEDGGLTL